MTSRTVSSSSTTRIRVCSGAASVERSDMDAASLLARPGWGPNIGGEYSTAVPSLDRGVRRR